MRRPEKESGEHRKAREPITGKYVSKLTRDVIEKMVAAISLGGSLDTATTYAGVSRATMHRWLADGRAFSEMMGPHEEEQQLKVDLITDVDAAMSDYKLSLTGQILQAGQNGSWQALAWLAERRWPDEFGRRQRIEHGNADGEPFRVAPTPVFDPSKLTPEELDTAIALLEKARPDGMPRIGPPVVEQKLIENG